MPAPLMEQASFLPFRAMDSKTMPDFRLNCKKVG